MLLFGWSLLDLQFPTLLTAWPNPRGSFRVHQLQLVSPLLSSSIAFSVLWQCPSNCLSYWIYCHISTPALAGSFSLESEWQEFPSSHQGPCQYSCRFKQYCGLDSLEFSFDFQFLQSPFETVPNVPTITVTLIFHSFSSSLARFTSLYIF